MLVFWEFEVVEEINLLRSDQPTFPLWRDRENKVKKNPRTTTVIIWSTLGYHKTGSRIHSPKTLNDETDVKMNQRIHCERRSRWSLLLANITFLTHYGSLPLFLSFSFSPSLSLCSLSRTRCQMSCKPAALYVNVLSCLNEAIRDINLKITYFWLTKCHHFNRQMQTAMLHMGCLKRVFRVELGARKPKQWP